VLSVFILSGCGPILGQFMGRGEGLKSFEVVSGQSPQFKAGASILVFGPFAKTADAFYICRGEDAAKFSDEFIRHGLNSELYLAHGSAGRVTLAEAKKMSGAELRTALGLTSPPDYLLSGTLTLRKMTVAPARGVVMEEAYDLELLDLRTQTTSRYRVAVKDLAQETIPDVAAALVEKFGIAVKK
ncbi:MAG: hypothetical protein Q7U44_10340, partial [Desulfuromonadales bacterium]|nr:hypothetical protein [Desulfuromonadales bacterium]